jgi:type II secretory pathway component GspD/PulD (secretin)
MFKKITITMIILISTVILLIPTDSFAQRGGGGGGRGGMGGMGGGMDMAGGMDMMMGRGGGFPGAQPYNAEEFKKNGLLKYLVDANGVKIDPNTLSEATLQTLYNEIMRGDRNVLDTSRFSSFMNAGGNRGGRGMPGMLTQEVSNDPNDDPMIFVNLNGVDISSIIQLLISWTGKSVLPSNEALGLTITVYSPQTMPRSKALNLLYASMRQQGFVADVEDDIIYIRPYTIRTFDAPMLKENEELALYKDKEEIVRKIFKVKNYSPSAMAQLILPFLDSYGYVTADESTGTLMIMDSVKTLMRVQLIIQQFDVDLAETITETLVVHHRNVDEMVSLLQTIMANNSITSSGGMMGGMMGGMGGMMGGMSMNMSDPRQGRGNQATTRTTATTTANRNATATRTATTTNPRAGGRGNTNMGGMMGTMGAASASGTTIGNAKPEPILISEPRNSYIIAKATPEDMETIKQWLVKLDTEAKIVLDPEELKLLPKNQVVAKFYYLQYNTPGQIAQIIDPLLSDSGYLSAEENTGTLFIKDTAESLIQIEEIIKKFDVPEADPKNQQYFSVKYGDPREIVELINLILSNDTTTSGSSARTGTGLTTGRNATTNRTTGGRTTGTTGRTTTGGMGGR